MAIKKVKVGSIVEYIYTGTGKKEQVSMGTIVWCGSNGRHFTVRDENRPFKDFKGVDSFEWNLGIDNIKTIK